MKGSLALFVILKITSFFMYITFKHLISLFITSIGESMSNVILKAFLEKRAVGKNAKTNLNLSLNDFNKRWFVLDNIALTYYDGKITKQGKEKGKIPLNTIVGVEAVDDCSLDDRTHVIQVIHKCEEKRLALYMVTRSKDEQERWIRCIRKEAKSRGANFSGHYHSSAWTNGIYTCCEAQELNAVGCKLVHLPSDEPDIPSSSSISDERKPPKRAQPEVPISQDSEKQNRIIGDGNEEGRIQMERERQNSLLNPPKIKYQVIYPYRPAAEDEMELLEGQILEIQNEIDENWWTATNIENGASGLVPANYLKEITSLEYYSWYFESVSKEECCYLLKEDQQAGCFLVRDSSDKKCYALSVFNGVTVKHYRIENTADNKFSIIRGQEFSSVPALIEHYHENDILGSNNCRLTCFPQQC